MGQYDKKVSKKEPDAPNSQKIKKKRSSAALDSLERDRSAEKQRNLKMLSWLDKANEIKGGGKEKAHLDTDKMVKRAIRKD